MKYYAVKKGRSPGLYVNYSTFKYQITGVSDAEWKTFRTKKKACNYLNRGSRVIYCFGGDIPKGDTCASIVNENGVDLLRENSLLDIFEPVTLLNSRRAIVVDFSDGAIRQTSGAELLSVYLALRTAQNNLNYKVIRSDSWIVLDHWSKQFNASKVPKMDTRKIEFIEIVIKLRAEFEQGGGVFEKIKREENIAHF